MLLPLAAYRVSQKSKKKENGNTTLYINDLVHIVSNENVGKIWVQRTMLKVRSAVLASPSLFNGIVKTSHLRLSIWRKQGENRTTGRTC